MRTSVILFLSTLLVQKSTYCVPPATSTNTFTYLLANQTHQTIYFSISHKVATASRSWLVAKGALATHKMRILPFIPSKHVVTVWFGEKQDAIYYGYPLTYVNWFEATRFCEGRIATTRLPPVPWLQSTSAPTQNDRRQISTIILPRYAIPNDQVHVKTEE